jgi:hypothetical protein
MRWSDQPKSLTKKGKTAKCGRFQSLEAYFRRQKSAFKKEVCGEDAKLHGLFNHVVGSDFDHLSQVRLLAAEGAAAIGTHSGNEKGVASLQPLLLTGGESSTGGVLPARASRDPAPGGALRSYSRFQVGAHVGGQAKREPRGSHESVAGSRGEQGGCGTVTAGLMWHPVQGVVNERDHLCGRGSRPKAGCQPVPWESPFIRRTSRMTWKRRWSSFE